MSLRSGHMKDSRLFETYLDERAGDPVDPRVADHLATCEACATRFDEMAALMNELRHAADADLDAAFPAATLDAQRQQILRSLEHVQRPARVISFPRRQVAADAGSTRMTPKWVAGAAAAGLFIGFAAGGYLGPERLHRSPLQVAKSAPTMSVPRPSTPAVRVVTTQPDAPDDDAFLMELEVALSRPHARELQPFDAMTPRANDIENGGR
jgi:hypothetical protein